ncbi:hypothetical protein Tco_1163357 [Tanacetum coccineum]
MRKVANGGYRVKVWMDKDSKGSEYAPQQQYENFAALSSETIDQTFNSTNKADDTAHGVSTTHTQGNGVNSISLDNLCDAVICGFPCKSNPTSPQLYSRDLEQHHPDDLEEKGSQWEMTMHKIMRRRLGYDAATAVESFVNLTYKARSDKGYHFVPPPLTGNFIPRKPDLTFMDEIVESEKLDVTTIVTPCNDKTVENKGVSNTVESNAVRMNNTSALIIEDWNSDDEGEIDYTVVRPVWNNSRRVNHKNFTNKLTHPHAKRSFVPQAVLTRSGKLSTAGVAVNTVRPVNTANTKAVNTDRSVNTAASKPIGNPQQKEYKEKGVIDSGCSRHMTGNKCYLNEYEDYDGRFVSFGDGKGRISRKGKIKIGSLDFDDVYFCKELKYNSIQYGHKS